MNNDEDEIKLNVTLKPTNEIGLEEVELGTNVLNQLGTVSLKKPNDIYYDMYKDAKEKASKTRKIALEAYLHAKHIKEKYSLEELENSDDEKEMDILLEN